MGSLFSRKKAPSRSDSKPVQGTAAKEPETKVERLARQCLEDMHEAFRKKDEELWRKTQNPETLKWLASLQDGLYLEFLIAFQVYDNNFPRSTWQELRPFEERDLTENTFLGPNPTHVLEYEVIPYSEVRKPRAEQKRVKSVAFALVRDEKCWIVPRMPSGGDLSFAREFLAERKALSETIDQIVAQMKPELREQLLVFQIRGANSDAVKFLVSEHQMRLSVSRLVVEEVWASRPLQR